MQENWLEIASYFKKDQRFVLAVIIATEGATYRKAGTMMLINSQQQCAGLLSGGCLEADIALHAEQLFASNQSLLLEYDLTQDADLLWGMGLGCEGKIDILLLPLTPDNNHLGFGELLSAVVSHQSGRYWISLPNDKSELAAHQANACFSKDINTCTIDSKGLWLSIPVTPAVHIGIIGAGPDAIPVVNMAVQLGWRVSLFDHRENALNRAEFSPLASKIKTRAEHAKPEMFETFDAAIVMTHNLINDQCYCQMLLQTSTDYIGLLGPVNRRDKILSALHTNIVEQDGRVFGPVGLDLGGRSPQAIALSILAQIQQHCSNKLKQHAYQSATYYEAD